MPYILQRKTVELCRQLDHCGASYLSVHSRTSSQLTGEINVEALKLIIQNVNCPVVANGGITTLSDCIKLQQETNCRGVMVANGLLTNPTLFSGTNKTTVHCVQNWVDICFNSTLNSQSRASFRKNHKAAIPEKPPNLTFQCFHHHLVFMLEKTLSKGRRRIFNNLQKFEDVLQFLEDEFAVVPRLFGEEDFENNRVSSLEYADESCKTEEYPGIYDYESSSGRYFESRIEDEDVTEEEYSLADIFTDN